MNSGANGWYPQPPPLQTHVDAYAHTHLHHQTNFFCIFSYFLCHAINIYVRRALKLLTVFHVFKYPTNVTRNWQKAGKKTNIAFPQ